MENNLVIVGIAGKKGSGKDTVAQMICEDFNYMQSKTLHFADPVKDICVILTGCDRGLLETQEGKMSELPTHLQFKGCKTYRKLLQIIGTEFGRGLNPNVWINILKEKVEKTTKDEGRLILIPDVRFQNEVELIKSMGGCVIRVKRCDNDMNRGIFKKCLKILSTIFVRNHKSEKTDKLKGIDYDVINNSTLEELEKEISTVSLSLQVEDMVKIARQQDFTTRRNIIVP